MKTIVKITALLLSIWFISCETDVPETDTISPTFQFRITGDGFDRTFTQDDDFSSIQLNLKDGATYDILFSGVDEGGVRRMQWELPNSNFDLQATVESPWQESNNGFTNTISWNGDSNNPITANIFATTFIADGDQINVSTYVRVEDYGGESGPPFNITEATLNVSIAANQETGIVILE